MAGKGFRTVQYADDFVLLVKEGSVLQGIVNRRTEIGRWFEIEMDMEKVM
jgi:hypothetical protein